MKTLTFDKPRVNAYVAAKVGRRAPWPAEYQAVGIEQDGEIIGGVVIDGIVHGARCSIHCAGEGRRWLTREFIRVVFGYVFNVINCKVVINPVDSGNADSIRFTTHMGFTEALRIEGGAGDQDLIVFTMPRADCRWLERV